MSDVMRWWRWFWSDPLAYHDPYFTPTGDTHDE